MLDGGLLLVHTFSFNLRCCWQYPGFLLVLSQKLLSDGSWTIKASGYIYLWHTFWQFAKGWFWKVFQSHDVLTVILQGLSLAKGAPGRGSEVENGEVPGDFALGWLGKWAAVGWVEIHLNKENYNWNFETRFLPEYVPRHWYHSSVFCSQFWLMCFLR